MIMKGINQYNDMADYYNSLMLGGYYDYQQQVQSLAKILPAQASVLEIGVGTGLMAKQLKAYGFDVTGVDHTEAMLIQARQLLGNTVRLELADIIDFNLGNTYQAVLSNGGVWYGVWWDDQTLGYCSHLLDREYIKRSIENVCRHLILGGQLILSTQEAHRDKKIKLPSNINYEQRIENKENGAFYKEYIFTSAIDNKQLSYQRLTLTYIDKHFMEDVLSMNGLIGPDISPDKMYVTFKRL